MNRFIRQLAATGGIAIAVFLGGGGPATAH